MIFGRPAVNDNFPEAANENDRRNIPVDHDIVVCGNCKRPWAFHDFEHDRCPYCGSKKLIEPKRTQ